MRARICRHKPYVDCEYDDGGNRCKRCGWNREEEKRRKEIPLTEGKNGLWRKAVGIKLEEIYGDTDQ